MFKLDDLIRLIEPFFRNVWSAVVAMFERHPARIGVSAVFLVAAGITGNFYVDRARRYQEIVSTTIRAEGEGAPQSFKTHEAFIMSTIDPKLEEHIGNAKISDGFSEHLQEMHQILSKRTPRAELAAVVDPSNPKWGVTLSIPDYIDRTMSLPVQNAILTDNEPNGVLFFPLNLLRTSLERNYERIFNESRENPYSRTLADAVADDPAIADDIIISRKMAPVMRSLTKEKLFKKDDELDRFGAELQPARVYYITKYGLNRQIHLSNDPKEQQYVYRNMFRATTFFPSRPYYVEAFKLNTPDTLDRISGPTRDSFYVSQPYPDLGGLGVVITLARRVSYASHSDAAICLDLRVKLENDVAFPLRKRLESFGATTQEVKCQIGFGGLIEFEPKDLNFGLRQSLEKRLNEAMRAGDLSTVVGNISILDDKTRREDVSQSSFLAFLKYPLEMIFGYNSRPITFAIPLEAPSAPSNASSNANALVARFRILSLNLERFQQITSMLGLVSVSLLALAFFMALLSWRGESRTRRSYEEAFKTVADVLYGAPTPYCRLSAQDTVVDCNTAFCGLLKMPADSESVKLIKGRTFESLVAPRSKATYHDVQQRRRAGQDVAPYTLYFTRVDGSEVETRVASGVLPGRTPRELPETFGIVIPAPNFSS